LVVDRTSSHIGGNNFGKDSHGKMKNFDKRTVTKKKCHTQRAVGGWAIPKKKKNGEGTTRNLDRRDGCIYWGGVYVHPNKKEGAGRGGGGGG